MIKDFVATFSSITDRTTWAHWYFDNRQPSNTIRHELYEQVIFPVLIAGYSRSDPWSLKWLERTAQNLYKAERLWAQVDYKPAIYFAKKRLALCPNGADAKQTVLSHLVKQFSHAEHEWPAGILCGMNGATMEHCTEILNDVELARTLDQGSEHTEFFSNFVSKVHDYQSRLTNYALHKEMRGHPRTNEP